MTDKRPDPKPRKYPQLWQSYLLWEELMLMRQRHLLRLSSISAGKSNMDETIERAILDGTVVRIPTAKGNEKEYHMVSADHYLKDAEKMMIGFGQQHPMWDWITSIKGFGAGGQASKVLALIDDIAKFDSIAKLWRYSGYGLYRYYHQDGSVKAPVAGKQRKDGENILVNATAQSDWDVGTFRDRGVVGWILPFNRTLKSTLYIAGDQFIRQQTPHYVDLYYDEKDRQRILHPEPVKNGNRTDYTDMHIHMRAQRKMVKEFLKDLWLEWRRVEGLPITEAYT